MAEIHRKMQSFGIFPDTNVILSEEEIRQKSNFAIYKDAIVNIQNICGMTSTQVFFVRKRKRIKLCTLIKHRNGFRCSNLEYPYIYETESDAVRALAVKYNERKRNYEKTKKAYETSTKSLNALEGAIKPFMEKYPEEFI